MSQTIPLAGVTNGIDRYDTSGNKARDAVNVFMVDGALSRRPAIVTAMAGPPIFLPPGRAIVFTDTTRETDRLAAVPDNWHVVGANTRFDGFYWGGITAFATDLAYPATMYAEYSTGVDTWAPARVLLDETRECLASGVFCPLARDGAVHFELDDEPWVSTTYGGVTGYFIRFQPRFDVPVTGIDALWTGTTTTFTMVAPGIRVFTREAVNCLESAFVCGGLRTIVGGDKTGLRGLERGSNLTCYSNKRKADVLNLTLHNACGIWGEYDFPTFRSGGPLTTTPSGTGNTVTRTGNTDNPSYLQSQPFGQIYANEVGVSLVVSLGGVDTIITNDARLADLSEGALEGFILEVINNGSGHPAIGQRRQVLTFAINAGFGAFVVDEAFSPVLNATCELAVIWPSKLLKIDRQEYHIGAQSAAANELYPEVSLQYSAHPQDYLGVDELIHYSLEAQLRYAYPATGDRYTAVIDPRTQQLVVTNGGRLLTFDGEQLKYLAVASDDDPLIEAMTARLANAPGEEFGAEALLPSALFYSVPPAGHLVTTYAGRLVVCDGKRVYYSLPHRGTNVWPRTFSSLLTGPEQLPLVGMNVLNNRLYVWNRHTIFEGTLGADGRIAFRAVSSTMGFANHHGVSRVTFDGSDALIGVTTDGIYAFAGGEPSAILHEWSRVMPRKYSAESVAQSSSCVWRDQDCYLLAIENDIIVFNYRTKAFFRWEFYTNITAMHVSKSASGTETVLIGTDKGLIGTLSMQELEDGRTITGSVTTSPLNPGDGKQMIAHAIHVAFSGHATGQGVLVETLVNQSERPWSSATYPLSTGEAEWDVGVWGTMSWATKAVKGVPIPFRSGLNAKQLSIRLSSQWLWELETLAIEVTVTKPGVT